MAPPSENLEQHATVAEASQAASEETKRERWAVGAVVLLAIAVVLLAIVVFAGVGLAVVYLPWDKAVIVGDVAKTIVCVGGVVAGIGATAVALAKRIKR